MTQDVARVRPQAAPGAFRATATFVFWDEEPRVRFAYPGYDGLRATVHVHQAIRSAPPMYGRSASGTSMLPSAFW